MKMNTKNIHRTFKAIVFVAMMLASFMPKVNLTAQAKTAENEAQAGTNATFDPIWPCAGNSSFYTASVYYYWNKGNPSRHSCNWNYQNGLDISGGKPNIVAVERGQVTFVGTKFGKTVIITHNNGYQTFYGHLSKTNVKDGQWVNKGQVIGVMGNTGKSSGTHLHFECNKANVWKWYKDKYKSQMIYFESVYKANNWAYNDGKGNIHKEVVNWLDNNYTKKGGYYYYSGPKNNSAQGFSVNFRMKAGAYADAYEGVNGKYIGRVYPNDVVTVTYVYNNGWMKMSCPWNNKGNKTIYVKTDGFKFKATKYITAYNSVNGGKVGRVYPNDLVTVNAYYNSSGTVWMKCICPWTGNTNKTIYIKVSEIY